MDSECSVSMDDANLTTSMEKDTLNGMKWGFDAVSLRELDARNVDSAAVEVFLISGSAGGAGDVLDALFARVGEAQLASDLLRLYIAMHIHLAAKAFAETIGVERAIFLQSFGSLDEVPEQAVSAEKLKTYLENMLEQCVAWRQTDVRSGALTVGKAKAYIAGNFSGEGMTLAHVAAVVNVSPAYFSHLFKRETGVNFVEHITSLRMEKARKLLCCSGKKITEVAIESGYNDYHYFSYLFKKTTGQTPSGFRTAHKKDE